jgi:hypothetical protein
MDSKSWRYNTFFLRCNQCVFVVRETKHDVTVLFLYSVAILCLWWGTFDIDGYSNIYTQCSYIVCIVKEVVTGGTLDIVLSVVILVV